MECGVDYAEVVYHYGTEIVFLPFGIPVAPFHDGVRQAYLCFEGEIIYDVFYFLSVEKLLFYISRKPLCIGDEAFETFVGKLGGKNIGVYF